MLSIFLNIRNYIKVATCFITNFYNKIVYSKNPVKGEEARRPGAWGDSRAFYCMVMTLKSYKASTTPWKTRPMPMAATKKPTMRVAASIPSGPMRPRTSWA
jgi:hypothetical protein